MRNEAGFIAACIRSLQIQTYPNIEIWVFDGGSTDDSKKIVAAAFAGNPNAHLVDNPERIQSAAWNKGILLANGDILSIVSAHAELAPDYAANLVETLRRTGADMVG